MNNKQIKTMDPYILLSWANMKLRDEFGSLEALCEDLDLEEALLRGRLGDAGYIYSNENNQFISVEA